MRRALVTLALTLFTATAVAAQTPAPVPVPARPDDTGPAPERWDDLPAPVRQQLQARIDQPITPQAILHVRNAVAPDADFRVVDHGQVLMEQFIRPAGVARITRPVRNAAKYGPLGAVMWPGVGPDGQYWCWKEPSSLTALFRRNWYCYLDNDGDGVSERLMENTLYQYRPIVSHFQFTGIGHDEGVRESATFEVEPGAIGTMEERVVLRFYGVTGGLVQYDGSVATATVTLELLTGPDRETMGVIQQIRLRTDSAGRAEYRMPNGLHFRIDGVRADGSIRFKLLSGLPQGRALLFPPLTREFILERLRESRNAASAPDPDAASSEAQPPEAPSDD